MLLGACNTESLTLQEVLLHPASGGRTSVILQVCVCVCVCVVIYRGAVMLILPFLPRPSPEITGTQSRLLCSVSWW